MVVLVLLFLLVSVGFPLAFFGEEKDPAEIEVRIIERILTDLTGKDKTKVSILGDRAEEVRSKVLRYSNRLKPVTACVEADVLLLTIGAVIGEECKEKPAFSLGRKPLRKWENCVGAFYWKKGRPNLIFLKERLLRLRIRLPAEYWKFIEPLNEASSGGRTGEV